jgi:hypothetical protein
MVRVFKESEGSPIPMPRVQVKVDHNCTDFELVSKLVLDKCTGEPCLGDLWEDVYAFSFN